MSTASLTSTPTTLDSGTSAGISVYNTGVTYVSIVNAGQLDKIRPGRSYDRPVNGAVTAYIDLADGSTGSVSYEVQGTRNSGGGGALGPNTVGTSEVTDGSLAAADLNLASVAAAVAARAELTGTFAPFLEAVNTVASSGAAVTIPAVTTVGISRVTLTANCTFTFPTATAGSSFLLDLTQDATGSRTATWPVSVKWPGGVAPTLSTGVTKRDRLSFSCVDGSTWDGYVLGYDIR